MTTVIAIAVFVAAWGALGASVAMAAGRRGHDAGRWLAVALVLGPLAVLILVDALKHVGPCEEEVVDDRPSEPLAEPLTGPATLDVLVGHDGSPESRAAADLALEVAGDRLGRLTIVTVVPIDCGPEVLESGEAQLREEGRRLAGRVTRLQVVQGVPARALDQYASREGFDLIAVGCRGVGKRHLFGSTARRLVSTAGVPVVLARVGAQRVVIDREAGVLDLAAAVGR